MGYVNSIGGDPINPNPYTYSAISMTGNITLGWPISGQSPTYSATDWIDVTSSAAYTITMPDATQVGTGTEVVFNNYGAYTITINDSAGGGITTIAAGFAKRVHVVTNTTAAGTWRVVNIGAGTSQADASALAGYGLVAAAGALSQQYLPTSYNINQTLAANARATLAIWIGGAGTFTLTAPGMLGTGWFVNVRNSGSGTLTLDAGAALINGASTLAASPGEGFTVGTDGINFYTIGKIAPTSSGLTLLNKSVAGAVDVTLTANEAAFNIINFTGAITANINVIVPTSVRSWYFYNNTTGAFTVTIKTAAGTGLAVTQTARAILYCDGTNVVSPTSTTSGTVTSITAGTGLSGGTITGSGTIALANTAVAAGSYTNSSLTVDAQGRLTAAASGSVLSPPFSDANTLVKNSSDATKLLILSAASITTGTTRTATFPDADITVSPLASPAFTGTPVAPTAAVGTNTTQLATTQFVQTKILDSQNITATGAFTFTTPATTNSNTKFRFILTGGGGGAGGGTSNPTCTGGAGAATTAIYEITGLTASTGYTGSVGAGGAGSSTTTGATGGNTTITIGATTVTAPGGVGSAGGAFTSTLGAPGIGGGAATNATLSIPGGGGGPGFSSTATDASGMGGASYWGGGGAAVVVNSGAVNGISGSAFGSGGGGCVTTGTPATGGNGANGIVRVEWVL